MIKTFSRITALAALLAAAVVAPAAHAQISNTTSPSQVQTVADKIKQTSLGAAAATQCVDNSALINTQGYDTAAIVVTGTFSGTLSWFGASDAVPTWVALNATPQAAGNAVQSTTSTGNWFIPVAGYRQICVEFSTYSSGTAVVTQELSKVARPNLSTTGIPFQCQVSTSSTSSVQVGTACAIQAGLSFYITGGTVGGDTATSGTNPATIQAGASTTCTTPTVLFQVPHPALSTVSIPPLSPPVKAPQGAGLCVLDAATGQKYVTLTGYLAP